MLRKLFLIMSFLIFSNQSFAFIEDSCAPSLLALIPRESILIMLLKSALIFLLVRSISVLLKKIFHWSREWMILLFLCFLYFSIDHYLFSIREDAIPSFLKGSFDQYYAHVSSDLMILITVLYLYAASLVSSMPMGKRVWLNWMVKIVFMIMFIVGHVVGYGAACMHQCTDYYSYTIGLMLEYNLVYISIPILISLWTRANSLLIIALSGSFYNLLHFAHRYASETMHYEGFLVGYSVLTITFYLFAIYTLFFCLTLIFTRSVKGARSNAENEHSSCDQ